MSMISELVEELVDNADLYTKELHDLMYRAANTIEMLSEKVREPKQGEWIITEQDNGHKWTHRKCSECGKGIIEPLGVSRMKFCPNCGADMKRGADDE